MSHEADRDVLSYWTHERMAAARPLDTDMVDEPAREQPVAADGDGGSFSSTDPAGMTEPVAPAADGGAAPPARTKGKLFFNGYRAGSAYCSASVLNTPSKSVVITAAHCVYGSEQGWVKDAVFVPSYDRAQTDPDPVGVWTARSVRAFDGWRADQTDYRNDVAYVTLNEGGGANKPVVDVVGGRGLAWGGPWLYRYDESTGLGYVRSLTSLWRPLGGANRGPYFTEAVKTMLDATAGD